LITSIKWNPKKEIKKILKIALIMNNAKANGIDTEQKMIMDFAKLVSKMKNIKKKD
jgi:hypothetical protein